MTIPRTAFIKGEKRPKQGRPVGVKNKNTQALKDMILGALDEAGGVDYLVARANDPKTSGAFLGLIGKVLPMQIANPPGEEFKTENRWLVEFVRPSAKPDAS